MACYRDSADWLRSGERSGHLVADSPAELTAMAAALELPDRLYHPHTVVTHYQLPVGYHERADALGVIFLERAAFTRQLDRVVERWEALASAERRAKARNACAADDAAPPRRKTAKNKRRRPEHRNTPSRQDARRAPSLPPTQSSLF
jgi:hypothetical protein